MNINFIPTISGKMGNYDLVVDGRNIVLDVTPQEAAGAIEELQKSKEPIIQVDLVLRALDKVNLSIPDPSLNPGNTQLLFIEGEVGKGLWGQELRVYDRISEDGQSFLMFALFYIAPPLPSTPDILQEQIAWSFYIKRGDKEVGKLIGWSERGPEGETRSRIIEALIPRLGRDLKIMI